MIPVCLFQKKFLLFYVCVLTDRIEMQHIKPELSQDIFRKIESSTPTKQDRENTDNTIEVSICLRSLPFYQLLGRM